MDLRAGAEHGDAGSADGDDGPASAPERVTGSPKSRPAPSITSPGCSAEITVKVAIEDRWMAKKNVTMLTAKAAPPSRLARKEVHDGREPLASCSPVMSGTAAHNRRNTTASEGALISLVRVWLLHPHSTTTAPSARKGSAPAEARREARTSGWRSAVEVTGLRVPTRGDDPQSPVTDVSACASRAVGLRSERARPVALRSPRCRPTATPASPRGSSPGPTSRPIPPSTGRPGW